MSSSGKDCPCETTPPAQTVERVPPAPVPRPHATEQRIEFLDVLRGAAIFGIFLMNMRGFKSPSLVASATGRLWHDDFVNRAATAAVEWIALGKFLALFAFLFGLGVAMQVERAERAGRAIHTFLLRRMIVLLILGVVHGIFLWMGDILAPYALFGIVGLLFIYRRPTTILLWSVMIFGLSLIVATGFLAPSGPEWIEEAWRDGWWKWGQWWVEAYSQGTWIETVQARMVEWKILWAWTSFSELPRIFAIFLAGLGLGKLGLVRRVAAPQFRPAPVLVILLPAGLLLSAPYPWREFAGIEEWMWPAYFAFIAGGIMLSTSYGLLALLLVRRQALPWLRIRLAAVGRTALSNYILQSVAGNALFLSFGLGLYGEVRAPAGMLIVVAVFLLQLIGSHLWLQRFRAGPFEWLWRGLSYLRWQPLKKDKC